MTSKLRLFEADLAFCRDEPYRDYHPAFGYVLHISDRMRYEEPVDVEVYNFIAKGLIHHHPSKRRFSLVLRHSPSRGLLKWTSNMISLRCAGQQDKKQARNLGMKGWVGFFGEKDWNPVFALTNDPCVFIQFLVRGHGKWFVDDVLFEEAA